ncbi:hypothetical protein [Agrobacterium vitis]|uniref:hypothetical protein n=1 Tax=Agrobacterium vitis TaxID=373 RepID=UPI0012E94ACF|nr:hypothetical protein [Agrobacterium vitis]MVA37111.1 hypothetical protein [Agrobacterium vitis]
MTTSGGERSSFGQPDFAGGEQKGTGGPPPQKALDVTPLPPMSRPVYPYPYVTAYSGKGAVTDASSWERGEPASIVIVHDWPGSDLFGAYAPAMQ